MEEAQTWLEVPGEEASWAHLEVDQSHGVEEVEKPEKGQEDLEQEERE